MAKSSKDTYRTGKYRPPTDRRYRIAVDGKDVLLRFGRHNGQLLSDVCKENPGYLKWILDPAQDFPREFVDVAQYLLDKHRGKR